MVNGTTFKTACKATVCEATLAATAIKRQKVLENGDCEDCPAKQKRSATDDKLCVDQVCATKGWGPNALAVCVDLSKEVVDALPAGVTTANIQTA